MFFFVGKFPNFNGRVSVDYWRKTIPSNFTVLFGNKLQAIKAMVA